MFHNIGSFSLLNGLMLIFLFQQEWFYRLTQQCCFAGHPKNQKAKASMPHEAIQMLSVLNLKEVSDIVNHKVSFFYEKINTLYDYVQLMTHLFSELEMNEIVSCSS